MFNSTKISNKDYTDLCLSQETSFLIPPLKGVTSLPENMRLKPGELGWEHYKHESKYCCQCNIWNIKMLAHCNLAADRILGFVNTDVVSATTY